MHLSREEHWTVFHQSLDNMLTTVVDVMRKKEICWGRCWILFTFEHTLFWTYSNWEHSSLWFLFCSVCHFFRLSFWDFCHMLWLKMLINLSWNVAFLSSDYVGFIKKCMKQMQGPRYSLAKKIDLEIQHLEKGEAPTSPGNSPVTHRVTSHSVAFISTATRDIAIFFQDITLYFHSTDPYSLGISPLCLIILKSIKPLVAGAYISALCFLLHNIYFDLKSDMCSTCIGFFPC